MPDERSDAPGPATLRGLAANRELYAILLEHGYRGVRIQLILRAALVLFVLGVVFFVPPAHDRALLRAIAVGYLVWAIGVAVVTRRGGEAAVRYVWLALFVDLVVLSGLTVLAGESTVSWTADLLVNGFFLIPLLAAAQLRPWVCAAVAAPTVAMYLISSFLTQSANTEPSRSILLRTGTVAALAMGCVLLSYLQRSRVLTIGALVSDRTALLTETLTIQDRERRELAENLHDGALQYVLAARMDLEDARVDGGADSFDRIETALRESATLLRSTMTELHPAVLEQSGLLAALRELAGTARTRGGFTLELVADAWDEDRRTSADALLFATARELLTNVVKHAGAYHVRIELRYRDRTARLAVIDDGRGIADGVLAQRLAAGHIGLASRTVRVEAAGGRFSLLAAEPHGTVAVVEVPAEAK